VYALWLHWEGIERNFSLSMIAGRTVFCRFEKNIKAPSFLKEKGMLGIQSHASV